MTSAKRERPWEEERRVSFAFPSSFEHPLFSFLFVYLFFVCVVVFFLAERRLGTRQVPETSLRGRRRKGRKGRKSSLSAKRDRWVLVPTITLCTRILLPLLPPLCTPVTQAKQKRLPFA